MPIPMALDASVGLGQNKSGMYVCIPDVLQALVFHSQEDHSGSESLVQCRLEQPTRLHRASTTHLAHSDNCVCQVQCSGFN